MGTLNRCNSYDNLPHNHEGHLHVPALISPRSAEEVDLSPPEIGVANLDFDPMSFQCSPPKAESECLDSGASHLESVDLAKDKPRACKKELDSGSQSQTPGSATSSEPVSPYQEKTMSPFFTLDLSPAEEKSSKPQPFSEKGAYSFSPKMGQKAVKSPLLNLSEPVSFPGPCQVPDVVGGTLGAVATDWTQGDGGPGEGMSRCPRQLVVSALKAGEEQRPAFQSQGVAVKKAELQEEGDRRPQGGGGGSSQSKPVPSGQTQPGTVGFPPFFL